jgi:hypothetical protein
MVTVVIDSRIVCTYENPLKWLLLARGSVYCLPGSKSLFSLAQPLIPALMNELYNVQRHAATDLARTAG